MTDAYSLTQANLNGHEHPDVFGPNGHESPDVYEPSEREHPDTYERTREVTVVC